jgi:hemerythrin-like domain-containing protein
MILKRFFMTAKPIKRNNNIVILSKDHHSGLLFCWKIRQGLKHEVAMERIIKYTQYFWSNHLAIHFREEEIILFPSLKDRLVQKAIGDHEQIKHQFDELREMSGNGAKEALLRLADLIDDHIRFEERELFPHFEKMLSEEQLEAIGKKLDEHPSPLTDDYEDLFWVE